MKEFHIMDLSKRLFACARYTDGFHKLADIGTDHAFLPIHAVQEGYVSYAQAIDNKEGPFVIAFSNVKKRELQHKIKVIKSDGIEKLDDDTDVCVIAGMGGRLIAEILTKHSTKSVKRFILQPNNEADKVRSVLIELNFKIIDELVIKENHKYYDVIVVEKGSKEYTSFELMFGPINLLQKPFFFIERIDKEINKLKKIVTSIPGDHQKISVIARIKLLEEAKL